MATRSLNLVIAVDGPAASGKGTIAKALARHYGLPHMDTGLLYRAVALNLLRMGGDPDHEFSAAPLQKAEDAELIDTSDLDADAAIAAAIAAVERRRA